MSIKENQLAELAAQLDKCSSCHLRGDCQAPVGWYGCPDSPIVFIGEGPGGVEDDYGCPLIGPSGQLLDKALWSVQMTRDRVLTTNQYRKMPPQRQPDTGPRGSGFLRQDLAGAGARHSAAKSDRGVRQRCHALFRRPGHAHHPAAGQMVQNAPGLRLHRHLPPFVHFAPVRTRPGTGQVGRVPRSAAGPGQSCGSLPEL